MKYSGPTHNDAGERTISEKGQHVFIAKMLILAGVCLTLQTCAPPFEYIFENYNAGPAHNDAGERSMFDTVKKLSFRS